MCLAMYFALICVTRVHEFVYRLLMVTLSKYISVPEHTLELCGLLYFISFKHNSAMIYLSNIAHIYSVIPSNLSSSINVC